ASAFLSDEKERPEIARKSRKLAYLFVVEKTARQFGNFAEADKADRDFYRKLTGNERLQILLDLSTHAPEQRLERVYRITKLSPR
ncbi:MAG: hypothetical protein LC627_04965, partial [Verrucomicrobiaceae bacterium]|nr:hypothetical protein [Verrucomicrobiaceae bacterium]